MSLFSSFPPLLFLLPSFWPAVPLMFTIRLMFTLLTESDISDRIFCIFFFLTHVSLSFSVWVIVWFSVWVTVWFLSSISDALSSETERNLLVTFHGGWNFLLCMLQIQCLCLISLGRVEWVGGGVVVPSIELEEGREHWATPWQC